MVDTQQEDVHEDATLADTAEAVDEVAEGNAGLSSPSRANLKLYLEVCPPYRRQSVHQKMRCRSAPS